MKRCKTCRHLYEEYDGELLCGSNDNLQKWGDIHHRLQPPSEDFGCTLHETEEEHTKRFLDSIT